MVPIELQELQDQLDEEYARVARLRRAIEKAITANCLLAACEVLASALKTN